MEEMHGERVGAAGVQDRFNLSDDAARLASGIWNDVGAPFGRALERINNAVKSLSLPAIDLNNQWHFEKSAKDGLDIISTKAAVNLSAKDFLAQNPGADRAAGNAGKEGFKVRHATTGEVDGGWNLEAINKDGSVSLTKDYSLKVQSKTKHDGLVETLSGVPEGHTQALEKKLAQLPANVLRALADKGYKVIATPTNTDALPELKGMTPRGWPKETSFDNSDGTHDNVRRVILAPSRYKQGEDFVPVDREEVLVHQIGHALDHAFGKLSNDAEFQKAFREDMKKLAEKSSLMNEREKLIYDYFNQKEGPAKGERPGSEEAFASLFGLVLTGPENPEDKIPFEKNFPNTIKVIRRQIDKL